MNDSNRILIVSDAWHPQINGVVTTLTRTVEQLEKLGHQVLVIGPNAFKNVPMPGYAEIRLALFPYRSLSRMINDYRPDAIHISTEGPLGQAARRYCLRHGRDFTSSFHTRFPEYVSARLPIPEQWCWRYLLNFHADSSCMLVATQGLEDELRSRGFGTMARWSRGVDLTLFQPRLTDIPRKRPQVCYMGRVAPEKNIEAFLALQGQVDADFVVIGDGPARAGLENANPNVKFLGYRQGAELAQLLADADCMVFPSRTDTFGLVMIESMACGTPVAAFPEQGPREVIAPSVSGFYDSDLAVAVKNALQCSRQATRAHAERFSWQHCTSQFFNAMAVMSPKLNESVTLP